MTRERSVPWATTSLRSIAWAPVCRQWLKAQNGPVPPRLAARWLASLADAVQHAHERGILHRDIKPDNVILASGRGPEDVIPRLTDFGLAKLLAESIDETKSDGRMGTPHYMAPEQAAGRKNEVGPATDVYALGATLYEILCGRPPLRGETDLESLRLLLDAEPVALRVMRPGLPRDLETICLKCLRKEPARRYASAMELREDLQRWLDDRPIVGRPVSSWERARGWSRRRPAVASLLGLVVLLAGGLVGGAVRWNAQLRRHNGQLQKAVLRADQKTSEAKEQALVAEERRHQADRHHYAESLRLARRALDSRQIELAQDILHDIRPGTDGVDPRGFAWHILWRRAHRDFSPLWGHETRIIGHALALDGSGLASLDESGKVLLWDLAPGMSLDQTRVIHSFPNSNNDWISFLNDRRSIATIDHDKSRRFINVFDFDSARMITRLDCGKNGWFGGALFDNGSKRVAISSARSDGASFVQWWKLIDGKPEHHSWPIKGGAALCAVLPHERCFLVVKDGRAFLLDPWTGERRVVFAGSDLSHWATVGLRSFSADGQVFAAHTNTGDIVVWDTGSGRELARRPVPEGATRIQLSSKGSRLAILSAWEILSVFEPANKRSSILSSGLGRHAKEHSLSFSSDESLLVVGLETGPGGPQPPEVWDIAAAKRVAVFPGKSLGPRVAFLPNTRSLILMDGTRPRIWRLDPPPGPDALAGHTAEAWAAAFSPDGKVLATGSDDTKERQTIRLWDPATGRLLAGWKAHTATVATLACSPDGRVIASGSLDSGKPSNPNVILWDSGSHKRLATLKGHTGAVRSLAFSPDGRWLASASDDLTARLWDATDGKPRFILTGHSRNLTSLAFSPDGRRLATASNDATIRLWDVLTAKTSAIFSDEGNVLSVAFAPDGKLLASVNEEGTVKLWDSTRGTLIRTIRGESDQLRCLTFTPDGHNVVTAGKGKVIRIWDIDTGQELLSLEGHQAQINALAFSHDGSILASCDHQGKVKLWRSRLAGVGDGTVINSPC